MKPPKKCKFCASPKIEVTHWKADKRVEQREGFEIACKFCGEGYKIPSDLLVVKKRELPDNLNLFSTECRIGYVNVSTGNHEKCRKLDCPCPCGHKHRNEPVIPPTKPPDTNFKLLKEGKNWVLYSQSRLKTKAPWVRDPILNSLSLADAQRQFDTRKNSTDIFVVVGGRPA